MARSARLISELKATFDPGREGSVRPLPPADAGRAFRLGTRGLLLLFGLSVLAAVPLFVVRLPPLQDLPQHLATVTILRRHPEFGFGQYYDIALFRTQYLAYYLAAWALSYPFGVLLANKVLFGLSLIALPWSMWSLLRALGRDERIAFLSLPLVHSAHFMLGFLNFVSAIPLAVYALSLAVQWRRTDRISRAALLALLLVTCFYTHVVPFALAALGATLVVVGESVSATVRRAAALIPSGLASLSWLFYTEAGTSLTGAAGLSERTGVKPPTEYPLAQNVAFFWMWINDVLKSEWDEWTLLVWASVIAICVAFGARELTRDLSVSLTQRLSLLFVLSVLGYLVSPVAYDWIWPVSGRFPILAALFVLLPLRLPKGKVGPVLLAAVIVMYTINCIEIARCFRWVESDEVGDFDEAMRVLPREKRVVGLILEKQSEYVHFSPFLHYVALYQVQKGGVVTFSFADFPQSPVVLRKEHRPPPVPRRWEWRGSKVDPAELDYYDYVLVRGPSGRLVRAGRHLALYRGDKWSVWRKRAPSEMQKPANESDEPPSEDERVDERVAPAVDMAPP